MVAWFGKWVEAWRGRVGGQKSSPDFDRVLDAALRHTDRITIRLRALERAGRSQQGRIES